MELRARGITAPEIAQALGVSTCTVYRYLQADDPPSHRSAGDDSAGKGR
ncbi:MAG TPA: helix-turn-helix domain-containing protein [Isosphaeraceae bacterium]|nr:helix-turn-helix domain-containing protein [Isosphaeraceae bacterium]